jgi:hypothetical protein
MNVSGEQERIDIERMRDSLSASLASLSDAIPQMAMQGQDPSEIVGQIAKVIELRKKGIVIEEAVTKVFEKPKPEVPTPPATPEPEQQSVDQMVAQSMGQAAPPAEQPTPPATEPTQAEVPPAGGQPPVDLAGILAQLGG